MADGKIKIWQIFFDYEGYQKRDPLFIPYNNRGRGAPLYENEVLLDVWNKKRYSADDYVGIVSWRFKEKTNLTYALIEEEVKDKDVYFMTPPAFWRYKGTISRWGHGHITAIAKIADKENLFPFKCYDYDTQGCIGFCNYFICKGHIFDLYCETILSKAVAWLTEQKSSELQEALKNKYPHRNNIPYDVHTFFLEGLFPIFVHYNKLSYGHIFEPSLKEAHHVS